MRRAAYIKALEEASKLPNEIPELLRYFSLEYSPRLNALQHIKNLARKDTELLFDSECADVLTWGDKKNAEDHDNVTTVNSEVKEERR
jgi:hypothetical protein